ncbi:MAG: nickel pincer cofactor biosynthesis protein LarC [Planctomycetota bacterium]|nr:MAG: nickel pincer cofactor biosynthesis protein LarC [Planctomycetota bacterium]
MKIAYLDCASGISGDMTLGALVDAGVDLDALNAGIGSLGWSNVRLVTETVKKKGFRATQVTVEHEPEHKHRHLHHIMAMIEGSTLSPRQQDLAGRIFRKLAEAEAKVHDSTIEKVHFHEVGAVDSICDIVGAAMGWDLLGVEQIVCSAVPTGTGFVQIAHGRCSIPAPATAELLRGVPLAESNVPCELTTPTGAAILAAMVDRYGPVPSMQVDRIGYGAGQTDLEQQANLLRLLVGETNDAAGGEQLWVLETNLDDTSGELVGHAIGQLWEAGALDVYTTAIQMKKNRPGITLSVLCEGSQIGALESILFRETTTLGIRRYAVQRSKLRREAHRVETPWGAVDGVLAWLDAEAARFAPEFESCRQVAAQHGVPLKAVYDAAQQGYRSES